MEQTSCLVQATEKNEVKTLKQNAKSASQQISEPVIPTLASGRSQRVRKLPKRWEDDNLETEFFPRKSAKHTNNLPSSSKKINNNSNRNYNETSHTRVVTLTETNNNKSNKASSTKIITKLPIKIEHDVQINENVEIIKNNEEVNDKQITVKIEKGPDHVEMNEPLIDNNINVKDTKDIRKETEKIGDSFNKDETEMEIDNSEEPNEEENDDPEFDPEIESEKLWCICRQPYDDRFMICCDCCEEWFHGKCVGITKVQGRKFEKLGQEWLCVHCDAGIKNGTERSLLKIYADKKRKEIEANEKNAKMESKQIENELKNNKKRKIEIKNRKITKDLLLDVGEKSPIKFPSKESIRKSKKDKIDLEQTMQIELKKSADAAKAALKVRMIKMQVSTENEPKKTTKDDECTKLSSNKHSPASVSSISHQSSIKKKHYKEFQDNSVQELFKVDPVLNRSLSTSSVNSSITLERQNSGSNNSQLERKKSIGNAKKERTDSFSGTFSFATHSGQTPTIFSQRSSVGSSGSLTASSSNRIEEKKDERRDFFRSRILEIFISRYKKRTNKELSAIQENSLKKKTEEIEVEFYRLYQTDAKKYCNKLRSLLSNLKDTKNELYRKVILDKISVERLAAMSVEELAGSELAKWREQEKKKDIDAIKRDQEEQASIISSMTKKTHKGDVMLHAEDENVLDTGNDMDSSHTEVLDEDSSIITSQLVTSTGSTQHSHVDLATLSNLPASDSASGTVISSSTSKEELSSNDADKDVKIREDISDDIISNIEDIHGTRVRTTSVSSSASDFIIEAPPSEEASLSSVATSGGSATTMETKKPVVVVDVSTSKLDEEIERLLISHQQHHNQNHPHLAGSPLSDEHPTQLPVYVGEVHMPDVGVFNVKAFNIGGKISGALESSLSGSMNILGRAEPKGIWDYVQKLMQGKKTEFGLIRLFPENGQDAVYMEVFEYLHLKDRYGVIKNSGKFYRDLYLIPLGEGEDVPEPLTSIPGFRIEPKNHRPNMLLGLLIKVKTSGFIDHHHYLLTSGHNQHHHSGQHHHDSSHHSHNHDENFDEKLKRNRNSPIEDEPYIPEPISTKRLKSMDEPEPIEIPLTMKDHNLKNDEDVFIPGLDPRKASSVSMEFTITTGQSSTNDISASNNDLANKSINFDMEKLKSIQIPKNLKEILLNVKNQGGQSSGIGQAQDGKNFIVQQGIGHNEARQSNYNNGHNYQPPVHSHTPYGSQHHEMHSFNDREPHHNRPPITHPPNYPPVPPHHYPQDQQHEMQHSHAQHAHHPPYPPSQQQHHHSHSPQVPPPVPPQPQHNYDNRPDHTLHSGHTPPHHANRSDYYGDRRTPPPHSQQYPPLPPHHHHQDSGDSYYDYPSRGRSRGRGRGFGRNHNGDKGPRFNKRISSRWDNPRY